MRVNDHAPVEMYHAKSERYDSLPFRRCGKSGVRLPAFSIGLWQNFGQHDSLANARSILRTAFDLGITHFDLANNYGPPYGSAEETFAQLLRMDFKPYRDELLVATKAGYDMWPGPYGNGGSRKYLVASLEQSLKRMQLDYVDIFYHHRPDPDTPLEETALALDHLVKQGKALYVGVSNYSAEQTAAISAIFNDLGTPFIINQSRYSMLERKPEQHLLDELQTQGLGMIAFSPLAQGMLTGKYLAGIPASSRAANQRSYLAPEQIEPHLNKLNQLAAIAADRGQSLAQMALVWLLRDPRVTSVLLGASSPKQLIDNVSALDCADFSTEELMAINNILT